MIYLSIYLNISITSASRTWVSSSGSTNFLLSINLYPPKNIYLYIAFYLSIHPSIRPAIYLYLYIHSKCGLTQVRSRTLASSSGSTCRAMRRRSPCSAGTPSRPDERSEGVGVGGKGVVRVNLGLTRVWVDP